MPAKRKSLQAKAGKRPAIGPAAAAQSVLASLKRLGNPRIRAEMETRYGIVTKDAVGIRMNEMQRVAKQLGRNHALALALWETGNYEARTVAAFVAEPERITPALMDRWCRDFDNWGICDTVCFKLFDQVPHAFGRVTAWASRKDEFQKRAAFALLACLALHDENADDKVFTELLPLIEAAATDERNFVKKGVSWALRAIGVRSAALKSAATALARRLASSEDSTSRWIGKDALRALT
jgi:3-methyladenine DNA glycosylase AlkD